MDYRVSVINIINEISLIDTKCRCGRISLDNLVFAVLTELEKKFHALDLLEHFGKYTHKIRLTNNNRTSQSINLRGIIKITISILSKNQ